MVGYFDATVRRADAVVTSGTEVDAEGAGETLGFVPLVTGFVVFVGEEGSALLVVAAGTAASSAGAPGIVMTTYAASAMTASTIMIATS